MNAVEVSWQLKWILGAAIILYVVAIYALSFWARGRIKTTEDFVVAGRRLPLSLAWATILATWFGACTMLSAADEVAREGLHRAALDPWGAGVCLLLAGLFFARPLWRMKLLTVCDFFRRRFGKSAEFLSACVIVPSYFGWIAAQFVGVAGMLHLFFGIPMAVGILLTALVGTGYTLLGGMWSVTLTDAIQIALVAGGLIVLAAEALWYLGGGSFWAGWLGFVDRLPPEAMTPVDLSSLQAFYGWLTVFLIGALGNLPGQDLMQRIFAARSERVARNACLLAGLAYIALGMFPLFLGLVAKITFPQQFERAVLPALANLFMHPVFAVIFILALLSAVLSTIDSAILSPAVVLAQNIVLRLIPRLPTLAVNRMAVLFVAAASLATALAGESMYSLLEDAYELTLVGLLVPLCLGLLTRRGNAAAALASMLVGSGLWLLHYIAQWECFLERLVPESLRFPSTIPVTVAALLAYLVASLWPAQSRRLLPSAPELVGDVAG